ncbi:hypothetical protein D0862_11925 [Hortaea werneckii]|uniref:Uncharacterized protein n=1 Tax=Hortaea werneckii TaxID=91943 RepID=A0A3M7DKL5_HORWE|nr:hypothetical protein D0863_09613 [Hortaea werneckii]RMY82685.1 hypothetical protein D0862_11925 [Hortaea werneckii]
MSNRRPNYEAFEFKIAEPTALDSIPEDEISCNTCGNDLDTAAILNGYGATQQQQNQHQSSNGDDAFPVDPAFAATRAAMAANTNTFGSPAPADDITDQHKSTSGTGSRSVNPFGRPCLFKFRLCRQHFSTHRRT